ncbi:MAG: peptidylprolyl isomerase [Defluviitaleaceae bacterium]|nr:peptidylprolyl isomerase [Defluviitaleaceae bacterium]
MKKSKILTLLAVITAAVVSLSACSNNNGDNNSSSTVAPTGTQNPIVTFEINNNYIIRAELYPDVAPNTVANFISLINQGFYDGLIFHRVDAGFMIQGGCPEGTGRGNPGYSIMGEFSQNGFENDLNHLPGVLSMARANDPNSAGSQFFIVHGNATFLDGAYASFGSVIEGMEVVDEIANSPTVARTERPLHDWVMTSVTVETFGIDFPEPITNSNNF